MYFVVSSRGPWDEARATCDDPGFVKHDGEGVCEDVAIKCSKYFERKFVSKK